MTAIRREKNYIIKKASIIFRHNRDIRSCEKNALEQAKNQGFSRGFRLSESLQNRGSRVRILLPLPNKITPSRLAWCSFVSLWFGSENPPAAKRRTGAMFGVFAPQNAVLDRKTNLPRSEAKYGILLPLFVFFTIVFSFSTSACFSETRAECPRSLILEKCDSDKEVSRSLSRRSFRRRR